MKQQGISKEQAYNRLRKMALDKNLTLLAVSKNIIDVMVFLLDSL